LIVSVGALYQSEIRRLRRFVWGASAVAAATILTLGWQAHEAGKAVAARTLTEGEVRDRDIAFYEARIVRDPEGSIDRAQLAGLYLQRARETANRQDVMRAEQFARESLAASAHRNGKARHILVSALLAQHRFAEGLIEAQALVQAEPEVPGYRALLGELQIETKDHEAARVTFEELEQTLQEDPAAARDLAITARLARWYEVSGRTDEALNTLRGGLAEARTQRHLSSEQVAWFYLRIGDLLSRSNSFDAARRSYSTGLEVRPGDHRLLASLARLSFAQHRWKETIDFAERSAAVDPQPATLTLIANSWDELGDHPHAEAARARLISTAGAEFRR
jgi:tetratricopeptide (TPR) repeat protein